MDKCKEENFKEAVPCELKNLTALATMQSHFWKFLRPRSSTQRASHRYK
ncbi:hypothetical protein RvY_07237 [Ramazzottius varieornatus]|uniref:Uncharacterized protein n=1 Tax=Ramazzottius varieornatus TaxID=947166 RepID=A0A1D1V6G4_RAMVA|nr:hypothetical protein RvY_07237 [Ramazzottius varieornatus]